MKHKHKTYSKPKRPFDKQRLEKEAEIKKEFGLKNKREIWKADAKVKSMRRKAKKLIKAPIEEQKIFFNQLNKIGLKVNSIPDILALELTDYLERRLQTLLARKKLATTMKGSRQLITHKKVLIDNKIINKPSYIVPVIMEDKITLKKAKKKAIPSKEGPLEDKKELEEEKSK